MNNWNPRKVDGKYNPAIGGNVPDPNLPGGSPAATYADLPNLRNLLNRLLDEVRRFEKTLEEEMTSFAMPVGDHDRQLREAHLQEWPKNLGEPRDRVSYRYYKALRFRQTASAEYIRHRYEEAARGVTGTNAIDVLAIVAIIKDEALLIQEFIDAYINEVDDSSEFRTLELFQEWVETALVGIRQFWEFFEEGKASEKVLSQTELQRISGEEAKQGQAVFKVKLNSLNKAVSKDLEFLHKNFTEFAPTFYSKFLGPALQYRLNVGRRAMPTNSTISREIESASRTLDTHLRSALADQLRRRELFKTKVDKLRKDMKERDKYRNYVMQLAILGSSTPSSGAGAMVDAEEDHTEIDYWEKTERDLFQAQSVKKGTFRAPHSYLDDLDADDAHPQYLLRSGGDLTGDVEMDPGVRIDGMRPGEHRHTGTDGTLQIDGDDILKGSVDEDVVNQNRTPERPFDLKVIDHQSIRGPGFSRISTTVGWVGNPSHQFELQLAPVIPEEEQPEPPDDPDPDPDPEPEPPGPWAWYYGDDLEPDSNGEISAWPNRVEDSYGGDLLAMQGGEARSLYVPDAFGGKPGVTSREEGVSGFQQTFQLGNKEFHGLTVVLEANTTESAPSIWYEFYETFEGYFDISWRSDLFWANGLFGGYKELSSNIPSNGQIIVTSSPEALRVYHNGTEITTNWAFDGAPDKTAPQTAYVQRLAPRYHNVTGIMVYDRVLNAQEIAECWAHAQYRYNL